MFRNLLLCGLIVAGMTALAGDAQAYYPRRGYAAPYYGYRYYATPTAGFTYNYAGYGPYYNYGYRYYNYSPIVYPAYPVYTAPNYYYGYYGPRLGVSYVSPRFGLYVGY